MRKKAAPSAEPVTHETWHRTCNRCAGTDGFYPTSPRHDECTGKCGGEYANVECPGPCECSCDLPLTRDEVMEVRSFLEKFRK